MLIYPVSRSHDGFKENEDGILEATEEKYTTQRKVYQDVGKMVLDNAFEVGSCSQTKLMQGFLHELILHYMPLAHTHSCYVCIVFTLIPEMDE